MNKKTLLFLTLSLFFLVACSSSPTAEEELADNCENGLSAKCLVGKWQLKGLYSTSDLATPLFSYSPSSTLEINQDQSFSFSFATDPNYEAKNCTSPQLGSWRIEGTTLYLKPIGDCMPITDFPFTVTLNETTLNLNGRFFHDTEVYGIGNPIPLIEIYSRQ